MLKRLIIAIILNAAALYLTAYALDEVAYNGGWKFLVIGGVIIGILNTIVKPILKIVTLPVIFFTGGAFLIVINGLILFLLKYILNVLDFSGISLEISGFGNYLTAALLFGLINWIQQMFFAKK